jgi:Formamidopyrimidine-DNA glycosylase H2TH domain/Formamidopyrimidine-DNA glycosylase N-terminal domain
VDSLSQKCICVAALRKGKQLCMVLQRVPDNGHLSSPPVYTHVLLHMGMSGRLMTPGRVTQWGHAQFQSDDQGANESEKATDNDSDGTKHDAGSNTDTHKTNGTEVDAEKIGSNDKASETQDGTVDDSTDKPPMSKYMDNKDASASFPPKYAHLIMQKGDYKVAFCDSRKFGKTLLEEAGTIVRSNVGAPTQDEMDGKATADATASIPVVASSIIETQSTQSPRYTYSFPKAFALLAPDGLTAPMKETVNALLNNSRGIKALILDQNKVVAGVGNWVADEVLYQCKIHPDQAFLTLDEACRIHASIVSVLQTAVDCLANEQPYPSDWLFGYRWTKKKQGKDCRGRNISFVTSGGRTSAIIASEQKLYKRSKARADKKVLIDSGVTDNPDAMKSASEAPTKSSRRKRQQESSDTSIAVTETSQSNTTTEDGKQSEMEVVTSGNDDELYSTTTGTNNRRQSRKKCKTDISVATDEQLACAVKSSTSAVVTPMRGDTEEAESTTGRPVRRSLRLKTRA